MSGPLHTSPEAVPQPQGEQVGDAAVRFPPLPSKAAFDENPVPHAGALPAVEAAA
jgi:hypothetical protein